MKSSLTVYKASAGSGKTFTLAVQFIKTLIVSENPYAYRHILAVTFTNKATAEMKDRILGQLYGIWKRLPSSDIYLDVLSRELERDGTSLAEEIIRQRAGTALCHILHDYSRFRVETIDSFFQSVMKNLAHELGLTANLRVDLNDEEVLNEAVNRIMERLHLNPTVFNWIMDYVNERIANNERWDIAKEVKTFGKWIFKEAYLAREQEFREILKDSKEIDTLRKTLHEIQQEAKDIVQSAAYHFREELENHGITCDAFKYGSTIESYLKNLEEGSYKAKFGSRLSGFVDDPANMLKKTDAGKPQAIEAAGYFSNLLKETHELYQKAANNHISAHLALKHLNPLGLLGVVDKEVNTLNRENNRFLLAKTPMLLHELIEENDAPFIFEKMGTYFHNIMIDEFQDTSAMQWKNFKILLLESMASGHSNLLVGDVKQSIYRWRNSDWTILGNIEKEMSVHHPDIKGLTINRRSERNIIEFNNALFTAAADALQNFSLHPDSINIKEAYQDVEQQCPEDKTGNGYVNVRFYGNEEDECDWECDMLEELCEQVRTLHEAGLPYNEMAILVRYRKSAEPIIRHFAYRLPDVKLVSDEAFLLSSSSSVNILVTAMRHLIAPDDRVASAYLAMYKNKTQEHCMEALAGQNPEEMLPEAYIRRTEELKNMPLYELQEELYRIFELKQIQDEDAYLFSYLDYVSAYLQDNPSDIHSFLNYWDETLCKQSIPSGETDGIRILTIHKSKGLQFHTVFAPYCDWDIEQDPGGFNRRNSLLWCRTDVPPYNTLPAIPISIEKNMESSIFHREYEMEHLQRRVDTLNMLYVAFTRAEKNLFVWCRTEYKLDTGSSTGDLIYHSLPQDLDAAENIKNDSGQTVRFIYGSPTARHRKAGKTEDNRMEQNYTAVPVHMHSYRARIEFCQSNKAEEFMESMSPEEANETTHRNERRRMGVLMHKIFSSIYTRSDVDKALQKLESEGEIGTQPEKEQLKELIEKAFQTIIPKPWFDGSMKLYNECPILTHNYNEGTGKYETFRPDRVMISPNEVVVVDFKFGKPGQEHRKQVADYMEQLRLMEPDLQIKGYLWYILNNRLEEVQA